MKNLTTSDRTALIRLAASLPVGDKDRRTILAGLINGPTDFSVYNASESDFEAVRNRVRAALQDALPHFPPQSAVYVEEWKNVESAHFDNPNMEFFARIKIPEYGNAANITVTVRAAPFKDKRYFAPKYAGWALTTGLYAIDDYKVWKTLARFLKPQKRGEYSPFAKVDSPDALTPKIDAFQAALVAAAKSVGK